MDFIINLLPLAVLVLLVAVVCANPIITSANGVFERVVYDRPTLRKAKTVVHFKNGQVCVLQGEINIPFAPGTDISIVQRKNGDARIEKAPAAEEVAAV